MNLAVFGKHEGDSGPTHVSRGFTEAFAKLGHSVDFLCYGDRDDKPADGVNVQRIRDTPQSVVDWFRLYSEVREQIDNQAYDIFHTLERYPYEADVRTVQWTSDVYLMWQRAPESRLKLRSLVGDMILNWASRRGAVRSSVVVASSPETSRQMKRYWRISPSKTIPLGIQEAIRTPPISVSDPPVVLIVGRVDQRKGYDRLLPHLDPTDTRYELRIIGSVSDERYAEDVLEGWTGHYLGFLPREELFEQYRQADIVVIPSYLENFSMVALEAIANGCVVVISNGCGFAQFDFARSDNGVFVGSSGGDLSNILIKLTGCDSLVDYKQSAFELSSRLTWNTVAKQYEEIYHDIEQSFD